jgi:hypothetical protein
MRESKCEAESGAPIGWAHWAERGRARLRAQLGWLARPNGQGGRGRGLLSFFQFPSKLDFPFYFLILIQIQICTNSN